jgi:tRNA pseudouridine55 synthase
MFGLFNINKPPGWTSRDVVNRVQRLVRPAKAGHAGTLDPLATGVLVVCVGQATRLIEFVQAQPKSYYATFRLGCESDTEDSEGQVRELTDPPQPSREDLERILPRFLGKIQQRPPAFSALKIGGQRAYDLARRGAALELAPREIEIHRLTIARYAYPVLELKIECGSGTYVRSLGRDIAVALGTAAIMTALVRTAIGVFRLEESAELESLTEANIGQHRLPATQAVVDLPQVKLAGDQLLRLTHGKFLDVEVAGEAPQVAALTENGQLAAILDRVDAGRWHAGRVFASAASSGAPDSNAE